MEFRDLKAQYKKYEKEIDESIKNVLLDATFIGGKPVLDLEKRLADYVGVKHCISCANGTDAMTLLMLAWDIKEGDAIFVPDFTFFSTGEIVSLEKAVPIFVDVEEDSFNMDPQKLEEAIIKVIDEGVLTPKVIIPVDLYGLPANYTEIEKIAKKYNLKVLEDGAQGFGGSLNGQKACSFGDAAITSFFPAKPLGCYGDGGAIFTDNDDLAKLLNSLKVHGQGEHKYDNIRVGLNSRLDTVQAAILDVKLSAFIDHELEDVNKVYDLYTKHLRDVVKTPTIPEGYYSSFAQYTITLKDKSERDKLQAYLKDKNIPSMVYYVNPMHSQKAFSDYAYNEDDFKVTNKLVDTVLSLPMHPYLREEDILLVCNSIKEFFGER